MCETRRRRRLPVPPWFGAWVAVFLSSVSGLRGQELALHREIPGQAFSRCASRAPSSQPTPEERVQSVQLASQADQAVVLGDLDRSRELLARATELNPASAELAYRYARTLEDLDLRAEAIDEYCRVVAMAPDFPEAEDVSDRLDRLVRVGTPAISTVAQEAFVNGVGWADLGSSEDALESFGVAVTEAPEWADPVFNRGVVRDRMGLWTEAVADFQRYLELRPDADDALAVSRRIGELQTVRLSTPPNPTATLVLGVLPGVGHFYSERPLGGLTVLAMSGGAVAAGLLVKEISVRCLTPPAAGASCPDDQIVGRDVERPYLIPSLGVAAGVTLIGAVEAFVKARKRASGQTRSTDEVDARTVRLEGPSVSVRGDRVDVQVAGLSFR
ncbi:MAG: hypothetical protein OEZ65_06685 [Gemmatimonadota bacterium]|nr:hypothetical protein [Gemmatimonadota bacterium]